MSRYIAKATPQMWDEAFNVSIPTPQTKPNMVDKPPHYNASGLECIDYIRQQMVNEEFLGYLEGNVLKYMHRFKYKNGVEDLRKARWYLDRLIKEKSNVAA